MKMKSQKLGNISKRIREAVKKNKGIGVDQGRFGVNFDAKTCTFVADGPCCALGHLILKEQPQPSRAMVRYMEDYCDGYGLVRPDEGVLEMMLARHLGVSRAFVQDFITGFDDDSRDDDEPHGHSAGARLGAKLALDLM
jgi:hypothetical protein